MKDLHLRFPTGNEMGANEEWIPGGHLPTGHSEAITDQIKEGQYTESDVEEGAADKIKEENKGETDVKIDETDKKKHEEIAGKIKNVLDNPPVSKSVKEIHSEKLKEAKTLEDKYQTSIKSGINLDVDLEPLKNIEESNDKDIDFTVKIAPNTTIVNGEIQIVLDDVIITKILFVPNSEVDLSQAKYDEILRGKLMSISSNLINPELAKRKKAVKDIRKGPLKEDSKDQRWEDISGAINVKFIDEHTKAVEELSAEISQKDDPETDSRLVVAFERGGTALADELTLPPLERIYVEKTKDNYHEYQRNKLVSIINEELEDEPERNLEIIFTETFIGGGSVTGMIDHVINSGVFNKYPNLKIKVLVLQETLRKEKDAANIDDELHEPGQYVQENIINSIPLIESNKLIIIANKTRLILGEDVNYQMEDSKRPIIVFKATENELQAYQLSPKGETTKSRDVLINLVKGKYKGEIGNIY